MVGPLVWTAARIGIAYAGKAISVPLIAAVGAPVAVGGVIGAGAVLIYKSIRK
jgi:hypothetical protein